MRMNWVEKAMMNNPIRAGVQRWYAAPIIKKLGGDVDGMRVLEPGCGNGTGVNILLDVLGAEHVDAFDLDEGMVRSAQRRLASRADRARVWQGSATEIEAEDGTYDAVVLFGVLHHLPDWRLGLDECVRVLKPGGRLVAEESFKAFICNPIARVLLEHPQEDRFTPDELRAAIAERGLHEVGAQIVSGETAGWVIAERPTT